jgi:hypothetical protein
MMRFVSDTTISRAEVESVKHISDVVFYAHILGHDYASWQKEIDAYNSGKSSSLLNAVSVLMKLHNVDEESAKNLVWKGALEFERRYCEERDLFIETYSPGPEMRRWFRLLELSTGGNAMWGSTTSRYNKFAPKPVHVQKTNDITIDRNATNNRQYKSPEDEQSEVTNGSVTNGSEKLTVAKGKVTHARGVEHDDAPKSKRVKVNGVSANKGNHKTARKDKRRIHDQLFSNLNEDMARTLETQRDANHLTLLGYT